VEYLYAREGIGLYAGESGAGRIGVESPLWMHTSFFVCHGVKDAVRSRRLLPRIWMIAVL